MRILYVDRSSGKIEEEKIFGRWAIALLYGESLPARLFSFLFLPIIARCPWCSKWYGYLQQRPASCKKVAPFIKKFQVDTTEFATTSFSSFNDFFIRKLKKESRPIATGEKRAVLPADGRYLVFPDLSRTEQFYVKGQRFNLLSFLGDPLLAERFANGSMVIARLCPSDYHRFHFPCDGIPSIARSISGPLFSVNPVALRKRLSILTENRRMVTEIKTAAFGTLLYVEVGATCVGTIHQTYLPEQKIGKGDEKGYFSFGGSSVILLFEKGRVLFDADLLENSARCLETKAFFGTSLGVVPD
ncbi:MAG: phosphatidylserine decarboxylase [Verrucomicrobiota bacterium]|nr:phosphatidylserine decarboxylase [Verrucomicrobiota bacterium]